jgi:hypothetical protein
LKDNDVTEVEILQNITEADMTELAMTIGQKVRVRQWQTKCRRDSPGFVEEQKDRTEKKGPTVPSRLVNSQRLLPSTLCTAAKYLQV